jgi:uncharacterized SAM-binding protein YcdF (DUF218 family)
LSHITSTLRRWLTRVVLLAGVLHLTVTFSPLIPWWTQALARPWHDGGSGTLIVLTGSEVQPDLLGYSSYWRAAYAVRAWKSARFSRILVTGKSANQPIGAFLQAHGVPAEKITYERDSQSTRESALFCQRLLESEPGPLTLLTSDFHTYRAWRVFRKAGLVTTTLPASDAGKRSLQRQERWVLAGQLAEETLKLIYYAWQGWI